MKNHLLGASWYTNLSQFQYAQPDLMQVKHSSCYFPRESVSFDLGLIDTWCVLHQILENVFELGGTCINIVQKHVTMCGRRAMYYNVCSLINCISALDRKLFIDLSEIEMMLVYFNSAQRDSHCS